MDPVQCSMFNARNTRTSAVFLLGRVMRPAPQQTNGDEGDDTEKMSTTSTRRATGNSMTHAATTVSSKVNIIQLNLQHNKAATAVLCQQLERLDNAVALIQEPWVRGNSILGLNVKNVPHIVDLLTNIPEHA